jgi:hypothetical protein
LAARTIESIEVSIYPFDFLFATPILDLFHCSSYPGSVGGNCCQDIVTISFVSSCGQTSDLGRNAYFSFSQINIAQNCPPKKTFHFSGNRAPILRKTKQWHHSITRKIVLWQPCAQLPPSGRRCLGSAVSAVGNLLANYELFLNIFI